MFASLRLATGLTAVFALKPHPQSVSSAMDVNTQNYTRWPRRPAT